MPLLMTDVAAGSDAALRLQQNMAAMPNVQQAQDIAMQDAQLKLQQEQENVQKTKFANIVAESGIKADQEAKTSMQKLMQSDKWKTADASGDEASKLRLQGNVLMEAGKYDAGEKALLAADSSDLKQQQAEAKRIDNDRQKIMSVSSVVESLPDDKVEQAIKDLPQGALKPVIDKVGEANWDKFTPKEKKAVVQNLMESANNKLQEQKIAASIQLAEIRGRYALDAVRERGNFALQSKMLTQDQNVKMWGSVNSALDRVQRDPATIKERERLDEEVAKAEIEATKSAMFSYTPDGSQEKFYSKGAYDKYMQAVRKRDKHIAAQLDEEEALVKTLPAEAGVLRKSQLDKIEKQRATLQLEEPGAKKTEAAPTIPTGAKTHDGFPARKNADGSYSTEVSITVTNPKLNGGKPTNIPSLWGGKEVDENTAVENALATGKKYESFSTIPEAVKAAKKKSDAGGAGAPAAEPSKTTETGTATSPLSMPQSKDQLVNGSYYQTAKGTLVWDKASSTFIEPKVTKEDTTKYTRSKGVRGNWEYTRSTRGMTKAEYAELDKKKKE
jgi:hypothetical protein